MMTQFSYVLHAADFVSKWGMFASVAILDKNHSEVGTLLLFVLGHG